MVQAPDYRDRRANPCSDQSRPSAAEQKGIGPAERLSRCGVAGEWLRHPVDVGLETIADGLWAYFCVPRMRRQPSDRTNNISRDMVQVT